MISADAAIADDVVIGPFCVVHANVVLEAGTEIGSHCVIGHPSPRANASPLRVGPGARIRSHCVLYEGSAFGPGLETGHHATLREGIGAGTNLRVGTFGDVQGDSVLGDYVRLHSNVFIAKASTIEDFVWVFPHAVFTDDPHPPSDGPQVAGPHVERYAVVGAAATLLPGVRIGAGAVVAAQSVVTADVAPETIVAGIPARPRGDASSVMLRDGSGRPAYPWTTHFARGYPEEISGRWREPGTRRSP